MKTVRIKDQFGVIMYINTEQIIYVRQDEKDEHRSIIGTINGQHMVDLSAENLLNKINHDNY